MNTDNTNTTEASTMNITAYNALTGDATSDTAAAYRWKITKDHISDADEQSDKGLEGPSNADDSVTSNPTRFSMYDDDGECYYEGMLYGDFDGFEPLDDFGTGNAGCTGIKIAGEWL